MIAGPNGAGKTTLAFQLLPKFLAIKQFVNADEIARGLNPIAPEQMAIAAGRLMLQRLDNLVKDKQSLVFETTGASTVFVPLIKRARQAGYSIRLCYLWLANPEIAKSRVRLRQRQGGHGIADDIIERRYYRGLYNVLNRYMALSDVSELYRSVDQVIDKYDLIAAYSGLKLQIFLPEIWHAMNEAVDHERK